MKKYATLLFFCCLSMTAKSQFCTQGFFCDEADVFCGETLNGFFGNTQPVTWQNPPPIPGFCGTLENPDWIGFVPCTPSVALQINAIFCESIPPQNGLQAAIIQTDDCQNHQVLACEPQIFSGQSAIIAAGGLVPGEVYYLLLDGFFGDVCNYTIDVIEGINTIDPQYMQTEEGYIDGPTFIPCPAGLATYTAVLPVCEAQANVDCQTPAPIDFCLQIMWTLPPGATFVGDSTELTITVDFSNASSGELSVDWELNEACDCYCELCPVDDIPPIFITVGTPTFTTLPPLALCPGSEFDFCGTTYTIQNDEVFSCQTSPCGFTQQPVTALPGVEVEISQTGNLADDPFVLLENVLFENGAPQTYVWAGPGIGAGTEADYTQEVTQPGIFSLTVTDTLTGCSATAQTVVLPGALCPDLNSPVPPGDDCSDAPPFCEAYLNGYCSVNDFFTADAPGNLGAQLGCSIDNNQWLSFVACEPDVTLDLAVSNCLQAAGLEISILQSFDCQIFIAFANCVAAPDGDTVTVTATGLIPGETYLLMVDGIGGDICQWEVHGTTAVSNGGLSQEDNTPGQVNGPTTVCLTDPVTLTFSFTGPICNLIDLGGCPPADQLLCEPHIDTCYTYERDTLWSVEPPGVTQFENGDSTGATVNLVLHPDSIDIPPGQQFVEFEVSVDPFHLIVTDTFPCYDDCLHGCETILPDPDGDLCEVKPLKVRVCKPDFNTIPFTVCPFDCVFYQGEFYCHNGADPTIHVVATEDVCGCADTTILEIYGDGSFPFLIVDGPEIVCAPDGQSYTISFEFSGFDWWQVYVNNDPAPFNGYTSPPIPTGEPYDFEIFAVNDCGTSQTYQFSGVHDCPCVQQTYDEGIIPLCPGDCYDLAGNTFCDPGSYAEEIFNPMTGCDDTYLFEIVEITEPPLVQGPVTETCNAVNTEYTVSFTISDGVPPYFVDGNQIGGNTYTSAPIPDGDPYFFEVTDSGQCGLNGLIIAGSYECACITDPGTMEQSLIATCESETVTASWNNDATLDGDDILLFVLHDLPGNSLGTVLGLNVTGTFGFEPGSMQYGQTYYISAIAGNEDNGTVDFADACLAVATGQPVIFYENPEVDILPPPSALTCAVMEVPLDPFPTGGSGQFDYDWSGPNFSSQAASVIVTEPGSYTLVLTDLLSGCTAEASVEVSEDISPPANVQATGGELTCNDPFTTLQATSDSPGVTFEWIFPTGNESTGPSVTTDIAGQYTLTATGSNGCTASATASVSEDFSPPANVQATDGELTCNLTVATLDASSGTASVSFEWTFPNGTTASGAIISTNISGGYTVTATGSNGCTASATASVSEDFSPPANVQATDGELTCNAPFTTLQATSDSPGVTFEWIFPTGNESTGPSVTTDIAGQYTLTATGSNGCTASVMANVGEDILPPANVQATGAELTCAAPNATLTATSDSPDAVFTWTFPNGNQQQGASILTNQPGGYTLTATGTNGCTAVAQSTLLDTTEPPENVTATDGEITCAEPMATLTASSSTPGAAFAWLLPDGNTAAGPDLPTGLAGSYSVTVTAPNGCTVTVASTVLADTLPPDLAVTDGFVNCAQPEATLTATSSATGVVFTWTFPDGSSADGASQTTSLTGSYEVFGLAANGCEATVQALVSTVPDPVLALELDAVPPTCFGDTDGSISFLSASGGTEPYTLNVDGQPLPPVGLQNLDGGLFQFTITDANGCATDTLLELQTPEELYVEIGEDHFVNLGESVILEMETNIQPASIVWTGPNGQTWQGLSSLTVAPMGSGSYHIVIADVVGCTAEDELQVFVKGQGQVFVPNVFSPNGDQTNDRVTVFAGKDVAQVRHFAIFDRWGNQVFGNNNFPPNETAQGWDGTRKGNPMNGGVFVYLAEVEFLTGEVKMFSGEVILVK